MRVSTEKFKVALTSLEIVGLGAFGSATVEAGYAQPHGLAVFLRHLLHLQCEFARGQQNKNGGAVTRAARTLHLRVNDTR